MDALPKASPAAARKGPPPPPRPRRERAQQAPSLPLLHEAAARTEPAPEPEERTLQVALPARVPRWVRSWLMLAFGAGLVVAIFWGGRKQPAPPPSPAASPPPVQVVPLPQPPTPPPQALKPPQSRFDSGPAGLRSPRTEPATPPPPLTPTPPQRPPPKPQPKAPLRAQPKAPAAEVPLQPVPALTREILRATLERAEPGLRACVREGWGTNATLGLSVSPAGQVRRAEVTGPVAGTETGRCIEGKLRALRFPPSQQGADKQLFWSLHLPEPGAGPGAGSKPVQTGGKPRRRH